MTNDNQINTSAARAELTSMQYRFHVRLDDKLDYLVVLSQPDGCPSGWTVSCAQMLDMDNGVCDPTTFAYVDCKTFGEDKYKIAEWIACRKFEMDYMNTGKGYGVKFAAARAHNAAIRARGRTWQDPSELLADRMHDSCFIDRRTLQEAIEFLENGTCERHDKGIRVTRAMTAARMRSALRGDYPDMMPKEEN